MYTLVVSHNQLKYQGGETMKFWVPGFISGHMKSAGMVLNDAKSVEKRTENNKRYNHWLNYFGITNEDAKNKLKKMFFLDQAYYAVA